MPPEAEGGGVEPPRSCDPAVFETAYRARGSPSVSGPDRSRTCTSPGKSRELSFELRSQDVVGRDRTCDAPRFRRALYQLSFDHMSRRGWTRTSSFLFVRQALSAIELLAQGGGDARSAEVGQWLRPAAVAAASGVFAVIRRREAMVTARTQLRDKGSNLDLHVQSVVSCRLDDPGSCLSVQLPHGRSTQRHLSCQTAPGTSCRASYVHATRLPFDPGSPAAYVHVRGTTSSWRGFGARVSCALCEIARQKHTLMSERNSSTERRSGLSLSGGASIRSRACSS